MCRHTVKDCELREFNCKIMNIDEIPQNHTLYSRVLIENKAIKFKHSLC